MLELFLNAFFTLFVITDPIGNLPFVMSLTAHKSKEELRKIALKGTIFSFCVLFLFAIFGTGLLERLGISIPAFHTAGGILLFIVAFKMLFGELDSETYKETVEQTAVHRDIALFPIAIPLLAGPGCMTAIILLMSKPEVVEGLFEKSLVLLALLVVHIASFFILLTAAPLRQRLGMSGTDVLVRIMGVILAALSVQYIADGIRSLLKLSV